MVFLVTAAVAALFLLNTLLIFMWSPRDRLETPEEARRGADQDADLIELLEAPPSKAFCKRVRAL